MRRALSIILAVLLLATCGLARKPDKNAAADTSFSTQVVDGLMTAIEDGLTGHNPRRMLSAFDPQMPGYPDFRDRIETMFHQFDSFRVNHSVQEVTTEGERGIALVDFQMEAIPRNPLAAPVRKAAQLRLECARGAKGWKIFSFQPQNFFLMRSQ
jgi:hypothetical protein